MDTNIFIVLFLRDETTNEKFYFYETAFLINKEFSEENIDAFLDKVDEGSHSKYIKRKFKQLRETNPEILSQTIYFKTTLCVLNGFKLAFIVQAYILAKGYIIGIQYSEKDDMSNFAETLANNYNALLGFFPITPTMLKHADDPSSQQIEEMKEAEDFEELTSDALARAEQAHPFREYGSQETLGKSQSEFFPSQSVLSQPYMEDDEDGGDEVFYPDEQEEYDFVPWNIELAGTTIHTGDPDKIAILFLSIVYIVGIIRDILLKMSLRFGVNKDIKGVTPEIANATIMDYIGRINREKEKLQLSRATKGFGWTFYEMSEITSWGYVKVPLYL
jgi:hypothetical protein